MGGSPNTSKMIFLSPILASSLDIPVGKNGLNCFYSPNIGTTKVISEKDYRQRIAVIDTPQKLLLISAARGSGRRLFWGRTREFTFSMTLPEPLKEHLRHTGPDRYEYHHGIPIFFLISPAATAWPLSGIERLIYS